MIGLLLAMSSAFAWVPLTPVDWTTAPPTVCPVALNLGGTSATWSIADPTNKWTSFEEGRIEAGANAWDAGPSAQNRGATWDFVRGADAATWVLSNNKNEVGLINYSVALTLGIASDFSATTLIASESSIAPCLPPWSFDIVYRDTATDSGSWVFSASEPSGLPLGDLAYGTVAAHEFGHALGFDHTPNTSVMEANVMAEFPGGVRIHEDDYVALGANYPGSSTGVNFSIGRWRGKNEGVRESVGAWNSTTNVVFNIWDLVGVPAQAAPNTTEAVPNHPAGLFPASPEKVYLSVNGTGSHSPLMEWTVSENATCFDGDDVSIGTRTPTVSANTPYLVGPSGDLYTLPAGLEGFYYVCVGVNRSCTLAETLCPSDNILRSEYTWYIGVSDD